MKIAAVQLSAGKEKYRNIERAMSLVKRACKTKVDWILLPEVFNYRGPVNLTNRHNTVAESIPGQSTAPFMEMAKEYNIFILLGSIYEKSSGMKKVYNTSVLINNKGKVAAKYRKINLFNAQINGKTIHESNSFLSGKRPCMSQIKEFKAGFSICYDLRFPEIYRKYAKAGCHILTVPSSFTKKTGQAHWETLLRARAIENQCFVIAPNQAGNDGRGVPIYGHSMIISPWGEIMAQAHYQKETIIYADLKKERINEVRKVLPAVIK